jgi:hypothetical protein
VKKGKEKEKEMEKRAAAAYCRFAHTMGKRTAALQCRFARAYGAPNEKQAGAAKRIARIAGSEGRKAGKTVLYCRAAKGGMDAIELQLKRLRSYAERNGYAACAAAWDCNASGASMERPALQKLLAGVRSGDVGRVIACDTARLARDTIRFRELASLFADCGAELIAVVGGRLAPPAAETETPRKALECLRKPECCKCYRSPVYQYNCSAFPQSCQKPPSL